MKSDDEEAPSPPLREALRARGLVAWTFACTSTSLLDEVLVAFATLRLHDVGASAGARAAALGAWVVGGIVGLAVVERRVDERSVRRALVIASVGSGASLVLFVATRSPLVAVVALFFVGAFGGTLHPMTKARCYAALPERPAIVNALASALLPLEIAAPIALGLAATRWGNALAVSGLLVAPFTVALAAIILGRAPSMRSRTRPSDQAPE